MQNGACWLHAGMLYNLTVGASVSPGCLLSWGKAPVTVLGGVGAGPH